MKSKYEEIRINGKRYLKHRYVWESNNGKIPKKQKTSGGYHWINLKGE